MRQQHRLVAGSGPYFEYSLVTGEAEELQISRVRGRLRDRLPVAYRERRVGVGSMLHPRGNEQVPRREIEGAQHRQIRDPTLAEALDQTASRTTVLLS